MKVMNIYYSILGVVICLASWLYFLEYTMLGCLVIILMNVSLYDKVVAGTFVLIGLFVCSWLMKVVYHIFTRGC
jgi:VanZ family protein